MIQSNFDNVLGGGKDLNMSEDATSIFHGFQFDRSAGKNPVVGDEDGFVEFDFHE